MLELIKQCDTLLSGLNKFPPDSLYLGPEIKDNRLALFEEQIDFILPSDFKYILKIHNGISLNGTEVFGLDKDLRGASLNEIYNFEHFDAENKMPLEFLPFSPDGQGNHYCLNLSKLKNNLCPIIFWQHDFFYETIEQVEECNLNFMDWIKEVMIDWILE